MARRAYISETDESARDDGLWMTGRFHCSLVERGRTLDEAEDLTIDAALGWARTRAEHVEVMYGDRPWDQFSAGSIADERLPVWPPPDLGPLVRRRRPEDRWRDRTGADPPIAWQVDVNLVPPESMRGPLERLRRCREAWMAEAARVAAAAGDVAWDSEPLDTFIEDLARAERRAGPGKEYGWATFGSVAMHLEFAVDASTAEQAKAEVMSRLDLAPGWKAVPFAEPAR